MGIKRCPASISSPRHGKRGLSSIIAAGTLNGALLDLGISSHQVDEAERELLVKHGLSGSLLGDLAAAVAEFDASVAETNSGRQGHILASAELMAVSEELVQLVGMMDGLNRYRFQKEPELLVAWEAARHIMSGPQAAKEEGAVTTPGQSGEVTLIPGEPAPAPQPAGTPSQGAAEERLIRRHEGLEAIS